MKTFSSLFIAAGAVAAVFNLFAAYNQAELNTRAYHAAHMAYQHRFTEGQLNDVSHDIAVHPHVHVADGESLDVRNVVTVKKTGGADVGSYSEATLHTTFCGIERTGYYRVTLGAK